MARGPTHHHDLAGRLVDVDTLDHDPAVDPDDPPEDEMRRKFLDEVVAAGMRPEAVADLVHDAVCNDRFWVFTDLNW